MIPDSTQTQPWPYSSNLSLSARSIHWFIILLMAMSGITAETDMTPFYQVPFRLLMHLAMLSRAYLFSSSSDIIYTSNQTALNFQDKISISFWLKIDQVPEECYVISHGSWEERYKVSVTPEKKLRWTVKTDEGTRDLDNSTVLPLHEFNHYTVCYTGYSMEIYVNGELDVFTPMTGTNTANRQRSDHWS